MVKSWVSGEIQFGSQASDLASGEVTPHLEEHRVISSWTLWGLNEITGQSFLWGPCDAPMTALIIAPRSQATFPPSHLLPPWTSSVPTEGDLGPAQGSSCFPECVRDTLGSLLLGSTAQWSELGI